MRTIAVALCSLVIAAAATASSALDVTELPKPGFPLPWTETNTSGPQLELVSSRYRSPAEPLPPGPIPKSLGAYDRQLVARIVAS